MATVKPAMPEPNRTLAERLASEYDCEVVRRLGSSENPNAGALIRDQLKEVDVAIEFTTAAAAPGNLMKLIEAGVPVVSGGGLAVPGRP